MRIFRAPDRERVLERLRAWARAARWHHPDLRHVGLFGSYATNTHGPGSDLDLLLIVERSEEPRWFLRGAAFETSELPVEADVFVYTEAEIARMRERPGMRAILGQTLWLF